MNADAHSAPARRYVLLPVPQAAAARTLRGHGAALYPRLQAFVPVKIEIAIDEEIGEGRDG